MFINMNVDRSALKALILDKLARHTYWGGKHTAFDNLQKGVPPHLRHEIKDVGQELIKEGFLIAKPTHYGLHVSLNHRRKDEIQNFIDRYLK